MPDCNHEEADTRIVIHLCDALRSSNISSALVRTVDTDVVVILVVKFYDLKATKPNLNISVAFGMGRNFRYIEVNKVCESLGESKSRALPVFHALSGCDTTSTFNGKGKRSAWQAWQHCDERVTATLDFLSRHPFYRLEVNDPHFASLERLVIVMYDKSSPLSSINEARMDLFCKHNRAMDHLPPTQVTINYLGRYI